jgi:hypothetical protein
MKARRMLWYAVLLLTTGPALAGDSSATKFAIAVDDGDDTVELQLDGEQLGFVLSELQLGETRSVVDKQGRTVLVTRTGKGFTFNVEGKTIEMPAIHGEHAASGTHVMGHADGIAPDHDVHMARTTTISAVGGGGTTIISGEPIDEATRDNIRSLLISAGHDGEIRFIDSEKAHGMHALKVIRSDDGEAK